MVRMAHGGGGSVGERRQRERDKVVDRAAMPGLRAFEEEIQHLAAKDGFCPNFGEATESCDCIVCRSQTLIAEWEDHPLFAATTEEGSG